MLVRNSANLGHVIGRRPLNEQFFLPSTNTTIKGKKAQTVNSLSQNSVKLEPKLEALSPAGPAQNREVE
jgi:hypothetical protein